MPEWALKLLTRYPTAKKLSKAKVNSVASIPYVTLDRAKEVVSASKKSVASATDKITGQVVASTVKQILQTRETIKSQTKIMAKECSLPEIELLKTFNGIGDFSAIGLLLEIQSVSRFSSAKKLSSYFGLHPVYKTSGDGTSGFHMSKQGRKEPRKILFMVALTAIQTNPHIQSIYEEHVKRGTEKMAAIGVCMHKILRIIYGMLKNNKAFDSKIDRKNREKRDRSKNIVYQDKNRRYQGFDTKAPISRRQNLKREERKQSHSDNITKCGIMSPSRN